MAERPHCYATFSLTGARFDPSVFILDFIERNGNPIYIYQGGTDDAYAIVSTHEIVDEKERDASFQYYEEHEQNAKAS